jgi:hypothetical protein
MAVVAAEAFLSSDRPDCNALPSQPSAATARNQGLPSPGYNKAQTWSAPQDAPGREQPYHRQAGSQWWQESSAPTWEPPGEPGHPLCPWELQLTLV